MSAMQSPAKIAARDQLLAERRRRSLAEVGAAARGLAEQLLAWDGVRRAATVAAYVSMNGEPGTGPLLDALLADGKRVLLPVLLPDGDLDWAVHRSPDDLMPARLGLLEPAGDRLGPGALATADVVLVPALAVSPVGVRLGRGGGSYDRALAHVPVGTPACALLYDAEVGVVVPVEPHDRSVTHVVTPTTPVRPLPLPSS